MFGGTEGDICDLILRVDRRRRFKLTFSMNLPMPDTVIPRPPNTKVASSAISRPHFVMYSFSKAICPAILSACSAYDIWIRKENLGLCTKKMMRVSYVVHLVRHIFEPGLACFNASNHTCKFGTNDGLRNQWLSVCLALVWPPLKGLLGLSVLHSLWLTSGILLQSVAESVVRHRQSSIVRDWSYSKWPSDISDTACLSLVDFVPSNHPRPYRPCSQPGREPCRKWQRLSQQ